MTGIEWRKSMLEKEPVRYHEKNGIARISFDRPEALNAMNKELLQKLASVLDKAKVDDAIKAVIITGTGEKAFSAGADIKFLNQASPLEGPDGCFNQSQN
jgi:enoyl-CoA hydratase